MRPKKKNSLALTVLLLTRERASTTSLGESYLIFSLFRRSLSDVRACVVYRRVVGEWYESDVSLAMRNPP